MIAEKNVRLIDAMKTVTKISKRVTPLIQQGCHQQRVYSEVLQVIAEADTVDAVEVVHGRWVAVPSSDMMTGKAYKCSECGKMRYGSYMPNYCQCCGAKMDGGGSGDTGKSD